MQNIVIVCADKQLRKDVAKVLGKELNFLYVDIEDMLGYEVLKQQEVSLTEAKVKMQQLEKNIIKRALEFKNCIVTISRDLFVSNDNFLMLSNTKKIFINLSKSHFVVRSKIDDKYRIEQELLMYDKINKLITINCDMVIEKEMLTIEEMINEINKKIN